MGVEKLSVSLDLELGEAVRASAGDSNESVSAWLAEAARARLRREALREGVAAWEKEFGKLTEAEIAVAGRALTRAAKRGRRVNAS